MDRNQLEEKIVRIAKEIFSIPKEQRNTSCEFLALRTKLADCVWRWAHLTWNEKKLENASCEIMDCVNRSLDGYKGNYEEFIQYLSASLKNEISRANEKLSVAEKTSIRVPEKKYRTIKNVIHYCEDCGKDIFVPSVQDSICKLFGITEKKLVELLRLHNLSSTQDTVVLDTADIFRNSSYDLPEEKLLLNDDLNKELVLVDSVFDNSQERTQPYLSALLVREVLEELESNGIDYKMSLEHLHNWHFSRTQEARKVIEAFLSEEQCPSQQEVAAWFGRDKTDASRTLSKIKEKMRKVEKKKALLKIMKNYR